MTLVGVDADTATAAVIGPGDAAEVEGAMETAGARVNVGAPQARRVGIALVGVAHLLVGDEVIEESVPAQRHNARIGNAIEDRRHLADDASALLAEHALGRGRIVEIEIELGRRRLAELGEVVEEHRSVGIEKPAGLQDVDAVVLLGEREELRGLRGPLGDLGLEPLDRHLFAEGPDLLDLVGIDGVIDLEVRDAEAAHRALALAEGLTRTAAGACLDQDAVLGLVLLNGDVEGIDAHRLEQVHLADEGGDVGDLAERIRETHDAEGVLGEDVHDRHGVRSPESSAR